MNPDDAHRDEAARLSEVIEKLKASIPAGSLYSSSWTSQMLQSALLKNRPESKGLYYDADRAPHLTAVERDSENLALQAAVAVYADEARRYQQNVDAGVAAALAALGPLPKPAFTVTSRRELTQNKPVGHFQYQFPVVQVKVADRFHPNTPRDLVTHHFSPADFDDAGQIREPDALLHQVAKALVQDMIALGRLG